MILSWDAGKIFHRYVETREGEGGWAWNSALLWDRYKQNVKQLTVQGRMLKQGNQAEISNHIGAYDNTSDA